MTHARIRFKLTLHYDGAAFRGWRLQPGAATVQGAIEEALSRLTGERRTVLGAGRTDTGVHATGQVAMVALPAPWTATAGEGGDRQEAHERIRRYALEAARRMAEGEEGGLFEEDRGG